jgi:uncharacterized membrane protein YeaQ/YmgE (transglycosylase-associated protein family)
MSLFVWIVLGLITGYFISYLFKRRDEGISLDLILGIVGALAGGCLFMWLGTPPVNKYYSVLAAITGAMLVLFINYGIRRSFTDRLAQERRR